MRIITMFVLSLAGSLPVNAQGARQAPAEAPSTVAVTDAAEQGSRLTVSGRVLGGNDPPIAIVQTRESAGALTVAHDVRLRAH